MLRVKTADLRQALAMATEDATLLRWLGDGFCVSVAEAYIHGRASGGLCGVLVGAAMSAFAVVVSERQVACVPCCGSIPPDVLVIAFMGW